MQYKLYKRILILMKTTIALVLLCFAATAISAEPAQSIIVQPHPVAVTFAADGIIEAVQQTEVAAQVPGRVLEIRVDAGDAVKKGQVLMRIDEREAAEAAAAAEAQYINAKAAYARTLRLVEQKFLSPAALDKTKADYDAAAASRGATRAAQSHALILSPINGIVARRHAELGDMAQPGKPLFTLYAPGTLRATANVPQYRLREVRLVKQAQVLLPELGKRIDSNRVTLLPTVDAATHVAQVRVDLPAQLDVQDGITPGMFVRVLFVTGQATKLTVPTSAIVRRGELAAVYVQSGSGSTQLRQLRLGESVGGDEVEVLAGLTAGEMVLIDPVKAAITLRTGK